jgi:hypothetical protein
MPHTAAFTVAKITEKLIDLGADELRVVEIIVDRLASGQVTYGNLTVDEDERNFVQETIEEVADASIYSVIKLLQLQK